MIKNETTINTTTTNNDLNDEFIAWMISSTEQELKEQYPDVDWGVEGEPIPF